MKTMIFLLSALALGVCAAVPVGAGQEDHPALSALLDEALQNNLQIQAAYQAYLAADAAVPAAKSLPDPVLTYGYFFESVQTRLGPQEEKFGFAQKVPFPGKLGLKGRSQEMQAQYMKEAWEAVCLDTVRDVKETYYDLYAVDKSLQYARAQEDLLKGLARAAGKKYEANLGSQQDVVYFQIERTRVQDRLLRLSQNRTSLAAKLNMLLNRGVDAPVADIVETEPGKVAYSREDLEAAALVTQPELRAAGFAVDRAEYERELASREYWPDFTVGVDYTVIGSGSTSMPDDGQDAVMGTVAVQVPLWFGRIASHVREKEAALKKAEKSAGDRKRNAQYAVRDLFAKMTANSDIVNLYETALLPQTEQTAAVMRKAYAAGEADYLKLLDAQRQFLETRIAYARAVADYYKSVAAMERVAGKKVLSPRED